VSCPPYFSAERLRAGGAMAVPKPVSAIRLYFNKGGNYLVLTPSFIGPDGVEQYDSWMISEKHMFELRDAINQIELGGPGEKMIGDKPQN
jgi:hypothetical protein